MYALAPVTLWTTQLASLMCSSPISFSANCAEWKGTQYAQWIAEAAPNATRALSRAESVVSLVTQLRVLEYCSSMGSGISPKKSGTRPKFCSKLSRISCLAMAHLLSLDIPTTDYSSKHHKVAIGD